MVLLLCKPLLSLFVWTLVSLFLLYIRFRFFTSTLDLTLMGTLGTVQNEVKMRLKPILTTLGQCVSPHWTAVCSLVLC